MPDTSVVIVAVPSNAGQLPGPEDKHCTLQYLGKVGDSGAPGLEDSLPSLVAAVSQAAAGMQPFTLPVDRVGTLGSDTPPATVWFLEDQDMRMHELRAQAMTPEVTALVEAGTFTKHPDFTPHVTIGYGAEVPDAAKDVTEIPFYAIALWWGDEHIVFPLGALATATASLERTSTLAIIDVLGNWHHPNTGKFVRKPWEFDQTLKVMFPAEVQDKVDTLNGESAGTFREDVFRLRKYLRELAKQPDDSVKVDLAWGKVSDLRTRYSMAALRNMDGRRPGEGKPKDGLPNMDAVDAVMDLVEEGLEFLETAAMYENHGLDENPDQPILPFDPITYDDEGRPTPELFAAMHDVVHRVRRSSDVMALPGARPAAAAFAGAKKPGIDGAKVTKVAAALTSLGDTAGASSAKGLAAKGDKAGLNELVDTKVKALEKAAKSLEVFVNTDPAEYDNPFTSGGPGKNEPRKAPPPKSEAEKKAIADKAADTRKKNGTDKPKRAPAGSADGTGGEFIDDPQAAAKSVGGSTTAKAIETALRAGQVTKAQQAAEKYLTKVNNALDSLYNITFASRGMTLVGRSIVLTTPAGLGSFGIVDRLGNWHSKSTGKFIEKPWKVGLDLKAWADENDQKVPPALTKAIDDSYKLGGFFVPGDDDLAIAVGERLEKAIDDFEDALPLSTDPDAVALLDKLRDGALYLQRADWWPEPAEDSLLDAAAQPQHKGPAGLEGLSFVTLADGTEVHEPSGAVRRLQALIKEKVPGTWVGLSKAANGFLAASSRGDLAGAKDQLRVVGDIMRYARDINGLGHLFHEDEAIGELEVEISEIADLLTEEDLPQMKAPGSSAPSLELNRIAKEMTAALRDPLLAAVLISELQVLLNQMNPRSPEYGAAQRMIGRLRQYVGVTVGGDNPGTRSENLAVTTTLSQEADMPETETAPTAGPVLAKWEGPLGFEGQLTGDNRLIAPGALQWADDSFPQPMRWAAEDIGAHDGARVIGTIEGMSRLDEPMEWSGKTLPAGTIFGWGTFDLGSDLGEEAQRQVVKKLSNGVSLDLDKVSAEMLDHAAAVSELGLALDDAIEERAITLIRGARNRAATLVALPAFEGARIQAVASWTHDGGIASKASRLAATLTSLASKSSTAFAGIRVDAGGRWGVTVPSVGYRWVDMPDVALEHLQTLVKQDRAGAVGRGELEAEAMPADLTEVLGPLPEIIEQAKKEFENPSPTGIAKIQERVQEVLEGFPFEDYESDVVPGFDDADGSEITGEKVRQALAGFVAQDEVDVVEAIKDRNEGDVVADGDDTQNLDVDEDEPAAVPGIPRAIGEKVMTPDGEGVVTDRNPDAGKALVELEDGGDVNEYPETDLQGLDMGNAPADEHASTVAPGQGVAIDLSDMLPAELDDMYAEAEAAGNDALMMAIDKERARKSEDEVEEVSVGGARDLLKQEGGGAKGMGPGASPDGAGEPAWAPLVYDVEDLMDELDMSDFVPARASGELQRGINQAIERNEGPAAVASAIDDWMTDYETRIPSNVAQALKDLADQLNEAQESFSAGDTRVMTMRENWVEQTGGLPEYIREVADALIKKGMDESRAIATAVNTIKRWARGGSAAKGQGGHVTAGTVAKAVAALAEWEAKKAAAHATAVNSTVLGLETDTAVIERVAHRHMAAAAGGPARRTPEERQNARATRAATPVVPTKDTSTSVTGSVVASGGRSRLRPRRSFGDARPAGMARTYEDRTSLVASGAAATALAAPIKPPVSWFADPKLRTATPLTVTKDGQVFGHLALWGSCHTAVNGECLMVPRSYSDYASFHLGVVECEDGTEVPVGRAVMNTGHAEDHFSSRKAIAHYENTGMAIADLRAGEDEHGVWVAGALRPDATPTQIRALKASPLSGDWRYNPSVNSLDLVMALAVNQPGFAVPRPKFMVASGAVRSLVAAGMMAPAKVSKITVQRALAGDEAAAADIRYLQKLAADARSHEAAQLKLKVLEASGVRRRVKEMAASLALTKEES